ncbi:MAG: hypothetical protein Q4C36_04790 [Coriobacteriia bacterium]|nr:hypothetical protein [Coriobacteriia bacterium]
MRFPLSLDKPLPDAARSVVVQVLLGVFCRVFDVRGPAVATLPANQALRAFREFSAACMEAASVSSAFAQSRRAELETQAYRLGSRVRAALAPTDAELMPLVSWLYSAIDITVVGSISGELVFQRCSFSVRYTPELCAFMSAFDSGFVGGLCGGGALAFSERITAGAPCCRALYVGAHVEEGGGR